jgi:hypothetical protein
LEDSAFRAAVETAGKILADRGQKRLLRLLAKDVQNGESWKDVLWHFFMRRAASLREDEGYGLWALSYGKSHPETAEQIGAAAKALLEDPMLTQQHRGEPVQWIALLADEFSTIDHALLQQALDTGTTIEKQAACAVISRLGSVAPAFQQRNRGFQIPVRRIDWTIRERGTLLELLRNFSRNADTVPEGTCDAIQELLYGSGTVSCDELNMLALEGENGSLIGIALRYCFRSQAKAESLIEVMGRHLNIVEQSSQCMRRLVEMWRAALTELTVEGSETRPRFIAELQRFIRERKKLVEAATELLNLGELPPEDSLADLLDDLISNHTYRDDPLLWQLSHLAISQLSDNYKAALSGAVAILNLRSWNSTELRTGTPSTFLTISLCLAALSGQFTVESSEAFYRGVKFLAVREPRNDGRDLSELFQQIEPLLALVPIDAIGTLFNNGLSHADAVVRGVSRFGLGAAGNRRALGIESA